MKSACSPQALSSAPIRAGREPALQKGRYGHIFPSVVNTPRRMEVGVLAMPFGLTPRVRRENACLKFSRPLSTVLFTNQTKWKIDNFLPSSHRKEHFV